VLLSVASEILEQRSRTHPKLSSREAVYLKLVLFAASIAIPLLLPPPAATAFATTMLILLVALGLRLTALYILFSSALLYTVMTLSALLLSGNPHTVTRFCLVAMSTLSTFTLLVATTRPSALKKITLLYLTSILFSNVLREVIDIATVYKARGSEGLKYWLQVATASIITSLARAQVLADALKARGVEITE